MIRALLALAGALWLTSCGEPERDWPEPSPALWEVSGRNGEKAWLFGTVHALPDGVEWRTETFERRWDEADLLVVEIGNLGASGEAAKAFKRLGTTQGLPALSARVGAADRPALQAMMQQAGMDDADFWDTETWAAALILADAARESEPGNGVDRALLGEGKPVQALESFVMQFARFDGLDEAEQRGLLASIAREAQGDGQEELVEAWLTGNLAALQAEMDGSFLASPVLRRELLVERNELFGGRIVELMERRYRPFVAVGAAHMLGAEGLPALLAARDYTVRRIQ